MKTLTGKWTVKIFGLTGAMFLFLSAFLVLAQQPGSKDVFVSNGVQRPHVSEKEGWERISAWRLTAGALSDKTIWRQKLKFINGKLLPSATAIHVDTNKMAKVWFDNDGFYFFNEEKNTIKIPLKLKNYSFDLISDQSLSFYAVKYWNENLENGQVVLINSIGDVVWKTKLKQKNDCISMLRPSMLGDVLVGITDCRDDEPIFKVEIWDKKRGVRKLPGFSKDFKWMESGRKIFCAGMEDRQKLRKSSWGKFRIYDRQGHLIEKRDEE